MDDKPTETAGPTPQERIIRASRVLQMLGKADVAVDLLDLLARTDALGTVLIKAGLTTPEELGERVLEARAENLEQLIANAQAASRSRSNVG